MCEANNFSFYGGYGHEVYGDQGYANTSQWHEAVYYSSPLDVFDNEADVAYPNGNVYTHNSTYYQDQNISDQYSYYGAPQSSSFSGGYVFDSQDLSYDYGTYHYEYYPVYYVYPTYLGNYPLTNLQYTPESFYYDYVPGNLYYYVPTFIYYTPTSTYNESDITYYDDSTHYYQSHEMSVSMEQNFDASQEFYRNSSQSHEMRFSMEQNFDASQEFNCNLYNFGKGSSADTLDSCKEIVGEGITTCYLFYGEYPETLNDAPLDDEAKSVSSNENLESDVVSNEAEENANITVNEEPHSIETNHYADDVDRSLIKKISSMSIDDVKEDIDENYENAKAFVYNEVLKGYLEIKNQLEDLEYECHSLEDILEEEEPESDSDEMDLNENVADDLKKITLLTDKDEESHFTSVSFSEESHLDSNEEDLVEDHQMTMEETQPSTEPLDVEEKDEIDPFLELCLIKENLHSGRLDIIEEHHMSVASSAIQGKDETGPFLEQSLRKEELHSGPVNFIEEHDPPVASSAIQGKDEIGPFLEKSLSKEELHSGPVNSIEEHDPPVASSAIEGKDETGPFLEQSLSKEEHHSGPVNSIEEHHSPEDSSVAEENYKMDTVPQLSLREDEFDSGSRSSLEELHTNMSSQERGEGELHSTPDMLAPAAPKAIKRKKRFSGLRKFFARMCCCAKKTA